MEGDTRSIEQASGLEGSQAADGEVQPQYRPGHSLLDVLMPATPPQPKNARVIRLFDLEASQHDDTEPEGSCDEPAARPKLKPEPKSRESIKAAKAARNRSLLAAARLI